jgi:hypothetical protein
LAASVTIPPTQLWRVRQLVMAGNLKHNADETWELQNAMVGYRVALAVVAQSAAWFPADDAGGVLCQYPSFYQSQVNLACRLADIAYASDSPSATCDALSAGLMIQAKQARLGGVAEASSMPFPKCDPSVNPDATPCETAGDD